MEVARLIPSSFLFFLILKKCASAFLSFFPREP
nr:MAG TPA: hypothetical protein [Caudoviricetes sp.]